MNELRADRWHSRDFPVLLEVARLLDGSPQQVDAFVVAQNLALQADDVFAAFDALIPTYLTGKVSRAFGGGVVRAGASRLTDVGRRATGLWPREDAAADALIDLLQQAADSTTDEDDAGNLRKAGRLLKSVPGNVIADVTAALVRQQAGL
ncbi:hypothetical protein [Jatrophihabitans sp.]|uniref:hypothetical protein n=1 Tax=Jatrophihabitans sp. TaxID=1932789 RepID=UPI0030C745E0|nr:hypothetical protein [Jatrophihabitans sp.]